MADAQLPMTAAVIRNLTQVFMENCDDQRQGRADRWWVHDSC